MSLCDGSYQLLGSYGIFKNVSEGNITPPSVESVFKHWCHYDAVSTFSHYFIGIILILICTMSIVGNLLVIVIFCRYRRLRSPANTLIVNLAFSDMFNGFLHPMAAYSAFNKKWMFGKFGCEMYAGLCGLFGLVSIVTLTAIAIERCLVISVKPWYGGILFTQVKAKISCFLIWVYCIVVVFPPFFGWGAFVPEGFLTSCSFDYITRTSSNRSYFFYIFIVGFFIPVTIIVVCYVFIMRTIYQNEKDMKKNNVKKVYAKPKKRNDYKAAEMIMFVIGMFLVSWTPYSVVAMIGQFGNKRVLTPWVSVLPSLFAKMSTIYNPAIYGLSHRHFRATLRRIFKKDIRNSLDRGGTYYSRNSTLTRTKNGCSCFNNNSDNVEESSSSFTGKKVFLGVTVTNLVDANKIIYVKNAAKDIESCRCELGYEIDGKISKEMNSLRDNSTRKQSAVEKPVGHAKPIILAMPYDPGKVSLVRSLMFKSESSIYQKYQTFLEEDRIIKIPSSICTYGSNLPHKRSEAILLPKKDLPNLISSGLRLINVDTIPAENLETSMLKVSNEVE